MTWALAKDEGRGNVTKEVARIGKTRKARKKTQIGLTVNGRRWEAWTSGRRLVASPGLEYCPDTEG